MAGHLETVSEPHLACGLILVHVWCKVTIFYLSNQNRALLSRKEILHLNNSQSLLRCLHGKRIYVKKGQEEKEEEKGGEE